MREARNWPVGLTDGAFGRGAEKPGQASEMDDAADSQSFDCPQSHETTLAFTGQAPMQKTRKWKSSLGF